MVVADDVPLGRSLRLERPLHLRRTLGPLVQGGRDPAARFDGDVLWRATRTPAGPGTLRVEVRPASGSVDAQAWGRGAGWLLDHLPDIVGASDDEGDFPDRAARHPVVAELRRRAPGVRIPRTTAVLELLIPVVLAQKVTGLEAHHSYRRLVTALGSPAPGPAAPPLLVPPAAEVLAATPAWRFHHFGVEARRAATLRVAAGSAGRLEALSGLPADAARTRLMALPGIGPWTAAEVARLALGDADAVSIGDYHLPDQVGWALAALPRSDDATMLRLLEPFRGHRARVLRLIEVAGPTPPRYGPRMTPASVRGTAWAAERSPRRRGNAR